MCTVVKPVWHQQGSEEEETQSANSQETHPSEEDSCTKWQLQFLMGWKIFDSTEKKKKNVLFFFLGGDY